jgi:hypothetical protein
MLPLVLRGRGRNAMAIRQELVVAQIFLLFNEGIF